MDIDNNRPRNALTAEGYQGDNASLQSSCEAKCELVRAAKVSTKKKEKKNIGCVFFFVVWTYRVLLGSMHERGFFFAF